MNDRLVWIDCEMTGLDYALDALIEIACVVTDFDLNPLGEGVDLVIKPPAEALAQMDDFVRSMHEKSGLLNELDSGITLAMAESQVLDYIKQHFAFEERLLKCVAPQPTMGHALTVQGGPRAEHVCDSGHEAAGEAQGDDGG